MPESINWGLPHYRAALMTRADRLRIDPRVKVRFDPDDLVNETLLRAVKAQNGESPFRGSSEGERFSYLFAIQSHVLTDWHRAHLDAEERSVRKEQDLKQLDQALTESLDGLANLAADQSSPSEQAMESERQRWLHAAIDRLPEREREAMSRRVRDGMSLADIAKAMGISTFAAGSLITRASARLQQMREDSSSGS